MSDPKTSAELYVETQKTKLTLSQINTLAAVAYSAELVPHKYKTSAIYQLQTGLRHNFDNYEEYAHELLTKYEPDEALAKLKADLSAALALRGLTLDARTANTVYSSHSARETSINPPTPFSGPRSLNPNTRSNIMPKKAQAADSEGTVQEVAEKKVRSATHAGKIIKSLCDVNPRRENTFGWHSMNVVLAAGEDGITYEDYVKGGGRSNDLQWDFEHGNVSINGEFREKPVRKLKAKAAESSDDSQSEGTSEASSEETVAAE